MHYLIVLVILSDPRPVAAIDTVLRRVCYILLPLSVVFVKYYPHLGLGYDPWSGAPSYRGVATSKNGLGALCLIAGIFFVWDTVRRWPRRRERADKRTILVNVAFLVMTLWLLKLSNSATSVACLVVGSLVIVTAARPVHERTPDVAEARDPRVDRRLISPWTLSLVSRISFRRAGTGQHPDRSNRPLAGRYLADPESRPRRRLRELLAR